MIPNVDLQNFVSLSTLEKGCQHVISKKDNINIVFFKTIYFFFAPFR